MDRDFCYIVRWGNGYTGGFDKQFKQLWNGLEKSLLDDLQLYKIKKIEVITPEELDKKRILQTNLRGIS